MRFLLILQELEEKGDIEAVAKKTAMRKLPKIGLLPYSMQIGSI